jgi:carbamoyl-phosphate synthase small subunit
MTPQNAILLLQDGTIIHGKAIGFTGTTSGEICFNTGMTGYQEIFTDPSYFGQIIINTMTHIGNYGVIPQETESNKIQFSGLVTDSFSQVYSRLAAHESLNQYLINANITGITGIDTRKLVRHLRAKGAMNAIISSAILDTGILANQFQQMPSMKNLELSSKVSTRQVYKIGSPNSKYKVAVLDLGIKTSILNQLIQQDIECVVFPAETTFQEMEKSNPTGYFLSNGPGDPSSTTYAINTTKEILKSDKPLFGICLGHQILGLAHGVPTYKMHYGHRGLNHPVRNIITGQCEITSQNHGFAINAEAMHANSLLDVTHINLNDNSIEGIRTKNGKAFSVQYHPESSPGPHDSRYLFKDFEKLLASQL